MCIIFRSTNFDSFIVRAYDTIMLFDYAFVAYDSGMFAFAYSSENRFRRQIVGRILWHGCVWNELECIERYNIMDIWNDLRLGHSQIECAQLMLHCPSKANVQRHPLRLEEMPRTKKKKSYSFSVFDSNSILPRVVKRNFYRLI